MIAFGGVECSSHASKNTAPKLQQKSAIAIGNASVDRYIPARSIASEIPVAARMQAVQRINRRTGCRGSVDGYPGPVFSWLILDMRLPSSTARPADNAVGESTPFGREDQNHAFAFQSRFSLHLGKRFEIMAKAIQNLAAEVYVVHLPPAKHQIELNFVAVFKKFLGFVQGRHLIVLVNLHAANTKFFQLLMRCGVCLLFFFPLFIFPLAVIHDAADRWIGLRGNLNEVQPHFPRKPERLDGRHDPGLSIIFINETNFGNSDLFVTPQPVLTNGQCS